MALINCPECNKEISDTNKRCPNCGYKLTDKTQRKSSVLIGVVIFIVLLVIGICIFFFWPKEKSSLEQTVETIDFGYSWMGKTTNSSGGMSYTAEESAQLKNAKIFDVVGEFIFTSTDPIDGTPRTIDGITWKSNNACTTQDRDTMTKQLESIYGESINVTDVRYNEAKCWHNVLGNVSVLCGLDSNSKLGIEWGTMTLGSDTQSEDTQQSDVKNETESDFDSLPSYYTKALDLCNALKDSLYSPSSFELNSVEYVEGAATEHIKVDFSGKNKLGGVTRMYSIASYVDDSVVHIYDDSTSDGLEANNLYFGSGKDTIELDKDVILEAMQ